MDSKKCPGRQGACTNAFVPSYGFVPDLTTLYEQMRGAAIDRNYPLTSAEILESELCYSCSHSHDFAQHGIRVFPTKATLALMTVWASDNAYQLAAERQARHRREAIEKSISIGFALRRPDKGLVNKTLAQTPLRKERHKKGRRYVGGPKLPRNPDAPKNYGEYRASSTVTAKKKTNKDKDAKKKGGKGR